MVFSSMTFLFGFLPIVLLIYYISPKKVKNLIIMISGILFYAWGEPLYVFVMLLTILVDYFAGLLMDRFDAFPKRRLATLIVSVVLNLGFLCVFKYGSFLIQNINALLGTEIFDPQLPTRAMLDPDMMVLEVKFTELLPSVIQELLPLDGQQFSAISKYTLCYEAAFFRTDMMAGISKTNRRKNR